MTQESADHGEAHALTDGEGGKAVPEVVNANILNAGQFSESPPRFLNVVQVTPIFEPPDHIRVFGRARRVQVDFIKKIHDRVSNVDVFRSRLRFR